MHEFFETSVFFGVFISLLAYGAGTVLKKKWKRWCWMKKL